MAITVTSKGQATIPKPVRDRLGIEPGTAVDFQLAPDGRVMLVKVDSGQRASRFEALRGERRCWAQLGRNHGTHPWRRVGMTLIDTNILLDIVTDDPGWAAWSMARLDSAAVQGPLVIYDVVYAELSDDRGA